MALPANATPNEVLAEVGYLQDRIRTLTQERNALPRNDKAGAHKMLVEINSLQAEVKRLKPALYRAEMHEQQRERHGMWVRAVSSLFGEDAPRKCFDWMKQQRKEIEERNSKRPYESFAQRKSEGDK